jgi:hypothetical protein
MRAAELLDESVLARLTDVELARLPALLLSDDLSLFIREAWPVVEPVNRFVPGKHIDAICDHLEAVERG